MSELIIVPAMTIALAVTIVFMVLLRPIAKAVRLLDRPGGRKIHEGDIPITGGIAMFAGLLAGAVILKDNSALFPSVFAASSLLVAVGVVDDKYSVPASIRFVAQIVATVIMVFGAGLQLAAIGDPFGTGVISMGSFTLIFTCLVTLTMINAYNLIDGVDGLAGTLALIAFLAVALVGSVGSPASSFALVASAAVLGYLLFNLPLNWNRSVHSFMGDAGSTLLGFTIVWITLTVSQGPERIISPVHCLWFAAIPIYDALTCFVRRIAQGKSPVQPARDHFHHTLRRGSMSMRQVLGTIAGLQLIYAIVGLAGHYAGVPDANMFALWSLLGLTQWWVIRQFAKYRRLFAWRRLQTAGQDLPG